MATARQLLARRLMSLPAPVLRLMAGGGAVYRGGRTLDPRIQFMAAQARKLRPVWGLSPDDARRAHSRTLPLVAGDAEPGVQVEPLTIQGPAEPIPLRAYRPDNQDPQAPVLVFAHLGGGVIGDLETSHVFCTILAKVARAPVLSVGYRLAPEHRFPAGLEDLLAAYRWARDHADEFGAPVGMAAVGGDAIGGGFAAVVCQDLKRAGQPQPVLQLLVCPWVDVACESASMTTYADAFPLSRPLIDWMMGHYLAPDSDPADPRLSPLRAQDLTGLAPAVVVTAGFDPLVDQGQAYARRLREAGGAACYRCYDGLAHGFTAYTGAAACADVACREVAGLVREAIEGRVC